MDDSENSEIPDDLLKGLQNAAEGGMPAAQLAMAQAYLAAKNDFKSAVLAYAWYLITLKTVTEAKDLVAKLLTPDQIAEANSIATAKLAETKKGPLIYGDRSMRAILSARASLRDCSLFNCSETNTCRCRCLGCGALLGAALIFCFGGPVFSACPLPSSSSVMAHASGGHAQSHLRFSARGLGGLCSCLTLFTGSF